MRACCTDGFRHDVTVLLFSLQAAAVVHEVGLERFKKLIGSVSIESDFYRMEFRPLSRRIISSQGQNIRYY